MKHTHWCRHICIFLLLGLLLGVYDGRIALWKDGEVRPWKVFPYPVVSLPEEARQQLKKGIPIESEEDLNRLLENFLS